MAGKKKATKKSRPSARNKRSVQDPAKRGKVVPAKRPSTPSATTRSSRASQQTRPAEKTRRAISVAKSTSPTGKKERGGSGLKAQAGPAGPSRAKRTEAVSKAKVQSVGRGKPTPHARPTDSPPGARRPLATRSTASGTRSPSPSAPREARKGKLKEADQQPSPTESLERAEQESERPGVRIGDAAPSFVLQDDSGTVISSESLRGSRYVLYFYPKDDTPGCTLQACGFRDSLPRFSAKGVRVLGVSPDLPESHARFKKKHGLAFPLLSDPEKTLAKAYGVWVKKQNYGREYMGVERSTFVVNKTGTIEVVWRGVKVPGHVDTVLDTV